MLPRISLVLLDVVGHAVDAQLVAELSPFAARAVPHRVLHVGLVPVAIRPLDGLHVLAVPVEAHEARRKQFLAEAVAPRGIERVVHEQRVADGLVDDAIENVCEELALGEAFALA